MTEETRVEASQESAEIKAPYAPPTFERIGSLGELTRTHTKGGVVQDGGGASRV